MSLEMFVGETGMTANLSVNRTACKLGLQVPSALPVTLNRPVRDRHPLTPPARHYP